VLHPFYIFQVFSIILWSMDEYYYYAACIFIISVTSVTSTLVETRSTMRRMREMARYICQVRVLRNGFWRTIPSTNLVPGDIYEISDPHLSIFPCDALLLTGDAIVNESMLTGESVPVSKLPCVRNEILHLLRLTSTISPELGKHFLFSGTKIVRVRQTSERDGGGAAVAMVVRTGFNTTKGALVRSMLFPRPNKFRFYADSFRFIGVMAVIAGLGFIVSIVNFINLGVRTVAFFVLTA
jgi:cation-transporting ATPase 13A3/4/5